MKLKGLIEEDFTQYKLPSMFLVCPFCSFKCEKNFKNCNCQNSELAKIPVITVPSDKLVNQYLKNPITKAIVFGGLEPFDSFADIVDFLILLRKSCQDPVIIYTGYYKEEIITKVDYLKQFNNIIIKFGRFIPNQASHFDEVLGVNLASDNQYAEKIC